MDRGFLENIKVGDDRLPDVIIDTIMEEIKRDAAAKADTGVTGGSSGKTFTQEEVNNIVRNRLAEERSKGAPSAEDERERTLKARESRLDCAEWLSKSNRIPKSMLDVLPTDDFENFKAVAEKMEPVFQEWRASIPAPYAPGTGSQRLYDDPSLEKQIAQTFNPEKG